MTKTMMMPVIASGLRSGVISAVSVPSGPASVSRITTGVGVGAASAAGASMEGAEDFSSLLRSRRTDDAWSSVREPAVIPLRVCTFSRNTIW